MLFSFLWFYCQFIVYYDFWTYMKIQIIISKLLNSSEVSQGDTYEFLPFTSFFKIRFSKSIFKYRFNISLNICVGIFLSHSYKFSLFYVTVGCQAIPKYYRIKCMDVEYFWCITTFMTPPPLSTFSPLDHFCFHHQVWNVWVDRNSYSKVLLRESKKEGQCKDSKFW